MKIAIDVPSRQIVPGRGPIVPEGPVRPPVASPIHRLTSEHRWGLIPGTVGRGSRCDWIRGTGPTPPSSYDPARSESKCPWRGRRPARLDECPGDAQPTANSRWIRRTGGGMVNPRLGMRAAATRSAQSTSARPSPRPDSPPTNARIARAGTWVGDPRTHRGNVADRMR